MLDLSALHQPTSLEEALELLEENGTRARPLAGGTSVVLSLPRGVDTLVDLRRAGLDTWPTSSGPTWRVGSASRRRSSSSRPLR